MVLVAEECDLVLSSTNYLLHAVSQSGIIATIGDGNRIVLNSYSESDDSLVQLGAVTCGGKPRCFAWRKNWTLLAPSDSLTSDRALNNPQHYLCVGDDAGSVYVYAVDVVKRTHTLTAHHAATTKAPITQVLFIDDGNNNIGLDGSFHVVACTATSVTRVNFTPVTGSGVSDELTFSAWAKDLGVSRPLLVEYVTNKDLLIIIRKTGECVLMPASRGGDNEKVYYLPSTEYAGSNPFIVYGQPLAASVMSAGDDAIGLSITFDGKGCSSHCAVKTTECSLMPVAVAPRSLISVVPSEESPLVIDEPEETRHIPRPEKPRGAFPHALPGESILDALHVPSTAEYLNVKNATAGGGYGKATGQINTAIAALDITTTLPSVPSTMNAGSSGILGSLMSISSDISEKDEKASEIFNTKKKSATATPSSGLYEITSDSSTLRPRIRNIDKLELSKLNIELTKPDMWAYQPISSFQGTTSPSLHLGSVVGLIAVGSTSDSVVHVILQCRHNGKLSYWPHTSLNINPERGPCSSPPTGCKGLCFRCEPSCSSSECTLLVLGAMKLSNTSLASASTTRKFRTDLFAYSAEQLQLSPPIHGAAASSNGEVTDTINSESCGVEKCSSTSSDESARILLAIANMQANIVRRLDEVDGTLAVHTAQLNRLQDMVDKLETGVRSFT